MKYLCFFKIIIFTIIRENFLIIDIFQLYDTGFNYYLYKIRIL
jgi:hypothetical protein